MPPGAVIDTLELLEHDHRVGGAVRRMLLRKLVQPVRAAKHEPVRSEGVLGVDGFEQERPQLAQALGGYAQLEVSMRDMRLDQLHERKPQVARVRARAIGEQRGRLARAAEPAAQRLIRDAQKAGGLIGLVARPKSPIVLVELHAASPLAHIILISSARRWRPAT